MRPFLAKSAIFFTLPPHYPLKKRYRYFLPKMADTSLLHDFRSEIHSSIKHHPNCTAASYAGAESAVKQNHPIQITFSPCRFSNKSPVREKLTRSDQYSINPFQSYFQVGNLVVLHPHINIPKLPLWFASSGITCHITIPLMQKMINAAEKCTHAFLIS